MKRILVVLATPLWLGVSATLGPELFPGVLSPVHAEPGLVVRRASSPKNTTVIVAPGSIIIGGSRNSRYSDPYNSRYPNPHDRGPRYSPYSRDGRDRNVRCNDRPSGIVVVIPTTQIRVNRTGISSSSSSYDDLTDSTPYSRTDSAPRGYSVYYPNDSSTPNFYEYSNSSDANGYSEPSSTDSTGVYSNGYWTEFRVPGIQSGF